MIIMPIYSLIYLVVCGSEFVNQTRLALKKMSVNIKSYLNPTNMLNILLSIYIDMRMLSTIVAMTTPRMCLFFWIRGITLLLCCMQLKQTIPNRKRSLMRVMCVLYCCKLSPKITPVPMM